MSSKQKITLILSALTLVIIAVLVIAIYLIMDNYAAKRSLSLLNTDDLPIVQIHSYSYDEESNSIYYVASGSGSLITKDHHILTNFHVISDDWLTAPLDTFEVCLTKKVDQKPDCLYTADLVDYKPTKDIAILRMHDEDIYGNPLPDSINTIDLNYSSIPVGEQIYIIGYPSIGDETITFTKGATSGFISDSNGLWIKTDSKVDAGNSGGAVINSDIELIGIPTFTITETETIAYFKPLSDIEEIINKAIVKEPISNKKAYRHLQENMIIIAEANKSSEYTHDYPNYTMSLEPGWRFDYVDLLFYNDVYISHEDSAYGITISATQFPYDIPLDDYKAWFEKQESEYQDVYYIFNSEIDISGQKTYEYDFVNGWLYGHGYFFTAGNYGFDIYLMQDSSINPEYEVYENRLDEFKKMLRNFTLNKKPYYLASQYFTHKNTDFSITTIPNWYIQEFANDPHSIDIYRKNSTAIISISNPLMGDEDYLSSEQALENYVLSLKYDYFDVEIIEKDWNYAIGNTPMIKIVYEYRVGRNLYREMILEYIDWENETVLTFMYTNKVEEYNEYLPEVMKILSNLKINENYYVAD